MRTFSFGRHLHSQIVLPLLVVLLLVGTVATVVAVSIIGRVINDWVDETSRSTSAAVIAQIEERGADAVRGAKLAAENAVLEEACASRDVSAISGQLVLLNQSLKADNLMLLGGNLLHRGEYARAWALLGRAHEPLLKLVRLSERRTDHWPTPSRALEDDLSIFARVRYQGCTGSAEPDALCAAYRATWQWGRELFATVGGPLGVDAPVAIVEDVVTTGGSVAEVIELVRAAGGVVEAVTSIIDRGGDKAFDAEYLPLLRLEVESMEPRECPQCAAGTAIDSPGSRRLS